MASDTRERILDAAQRLFYEQGFVGTGIATILREADVHSGSLYHAFENKESLLLAVLELYRDNLRQVVLDPVEAKQTDPIERIFDLLAWYRGGMESMGCRLGCPVGNLALEVSDTYPAAKPLLHANFEGWADGILTWLNEAGDRLPAWCDRRGLSRLILSIMEGGLMQARAQGSLEAFDAGVGQLRSYIDLLQSHGATGAPHPGAKP